MGPRPRVNLAIAIAVVIALACTGPPGGASSTPTPSSTSTSSAPTDAAIVIATPIPTSGATAGLGPNGPTEAATVVRVVDGDTIVVDRGRGEEKLRYIGMDTPETVKPGSPVEWMGPQASAANKALVGGRQVILEKDVSETDRFGRLLRDVWLQRPEGWLMVNLELVRTGFAAVSTYPPDVKYVDLLLAAQREAREAGAGLWADQPEPSPTATTTSGGGTASCDSSYPTVCIPPPPPDLDCGDVPFRNFKVVGADPHRFDGNHDGVGCET
jgi:micrococcal nuclease